MTMKKLWISSPMATGIITTENNIIVEAPPIWHKFLGSHYINLVTWLRTKNKNIEVKEL